MTSHKRLKSQAWLHKYKIRLIKSSKKSKFPKRQGRIRNKDHTGLSKNCTDKKIVFLVLGPTLLSQEQKQAKTKTKIKTGTETSVRSCPIYVTRKATTPRDVLSHKTSDNLDELHGGDC